MLNSFEPHTDVPTGSESRYRELFNAIDEGFCIIEVLFEGNEPVDYRFLEVNAAFEAQTGLTNAVGRRVRAMVPSHEQHWFEIYGRIAVTGKPERFEDRAEALGRYYDVYAFRVGEPDERWVAVLFKDIRKQKLAEAALEALNRELELKVMERTKQVRELAAQLTLVEAREQARLAQVLHDDLQQQLYTVGFALRELRPHLQQDPEAAEKLADVKALLGDAVAVLRGITANLAPPVLRQEGLAEALAWLGNDMSSRYGLSVTVDASLELVIDNKAARVLLFNMVRELLFNIVKHAAQVQPRQWSS